MYFFFPRVCRPLPPSLFLRVEAGDFDSAPFRPWPPRWLAVGRHRRSAAVSPGCGAVRPAEGIWPSATARTLAIPACVLPAVLAVRASGVAGRSVFCVPA
jgi:hypothetical protein